MHQLIKLFKKPHPFIFDIKSVVIPGLVTFLLIVIFTPFGFNSLPTGYLIAFALLLGITASFSTMAVVFIIKWVLPSWVKHENWTIGREIALILTVVATIATIIFLVFVMTDITNTSGWQLFQLVFIKTLLFSFFPVVFLVLIEQYGYQKSKLKQAKTLNDELRKKASPKAGETKKPVIFKADNGKPELQLNSSEILYLKSDGNYVEVYFFADRNEVNKKLIRNRLKVFVDLLDSTQFFYCHKSYLVNLKHILSVEGNARSLELSLRGTDIKIPVSRSKYNQLLAELKKA